MCILLFIYIFIECILLLSLLLQHTSKTFKDFISDYNNTNIKAETKIYKQEIPKKQEINKKEIFNNNKENDELRKQLNEERNKNKILENENKSLKNKINKLTLDYNNNIKKYEIDMNKLIEKNKELEKLIDEQKKEINDYIFKLNNLSDNNQVIAFKPGDKIISVNFLTQGNQDIFNYSMACKTSDLFVRLEERLYQDYPKFRNVETFFMVNANRILRFKTLEENNIKNNTIISLFTIE